jgi:hypothetical protein
MTPTSGSDAGGTGRASATGYALATLGLVAIGLGLAARRPGVDTSAMAAGALAAWVVQVAAVAAASTSVGQELPLAYGVSLVILLLVEAVWLSRCRWRTGSGGLEAGTRNAGR